MLAQAEARAPLEEGIVNVKAIDSARGAGPAAVAMVNGDRNHPTLGASALSSHDDQLD